MKSLLVLVYTIALYLTLCSSAHHRPFFMNEEFAAYSDECQKNASITFDVIKESWHQDEPPENLLCYFKCLMEKTELLNSDGTLEEAKVSKMIEKGQFDETEQKEVTECISKLETKINECADVKDIMQCLPRKNKH